MNPIGLLPRLLAFPLPGGASNPIPLSPSAGFRFDGFSRVRGRAMEPRPIQIHLLRSLPPDGKEIPRKSS
ncbi:MAG: hypothetical protein EBT77_01420 [Verrucomicrobia bacterium]|nr:hypothetical protein [Verrucomicrobiota bacterium]